MHIFLEVTNARNWRARSHTETHSMKIHIYCNQPTYIHTYIHTYLQLATRIRRNINDSNLFSVYHRKEFEKSSQQYHRRGNMLQQGHIQRIQNTTTTTTTVNGEFLCRNCEEWLTRRLAECLMHFPNQTCTSSYSVSKRVLVAR